MSDLRRFGPDGPSFVLRVFDDVSPEAPLQPGPPLSSLSEPLARQLFGSGKSTFAVLDATHMMGLQETLAASGLNHRCLFTGDALDDLGDVAPWLVELSSDNKFTRQLFTKGDAKWQYWGEPVGLFVMSDWGFDDVWAHLRRHTRLTQKTGNKNFFWRFWEPEFWHATAQLSDSAWVEDWPWSFCQPFKRMNFIYCDVFHSLDFSADGPKHNTAIPKVNLSGLSVLQLVMARPALAAACRTLRTDNWVVPYTSYFARHADLPDAEVDALTQLDPTQGKRFMCEGLLSNTSLPPHYVARGLQHILHSGGAT